METDTDRTPILSDKVVEGRMLLLAELQGALAALRVHATLARNHCLVLRYNERPHRQSGLTDPKLHVFLAGGMRAVTSDGNSYVLPDGKSYPSDDPTAAAKAIAADTSA